MSEDPYHTEFVSWRVDHFSFSYFFSTRGGGQTLSGKFHYFFFNPSLNKVKIKKTHASVPNTMMLEALRKDD